MKSFNNTNNHHRHDDSTKFCFRQIVKISSLKQIINLDPHKNIFVKIFFPWTSPLLVKRHDPYGFLKEARPDFGKALLGPEKTEVFFSLRWEIYPTLGPLAQSAVFLFRLVVLIMLF
jgi:hypothetical protein